MRRTLTWMSVLATAAMCGCASRGNVEMLESQLRRQEDQIYALRRELKSTQSELAAAKRETVALRERTPDQTASAAPEQVQALHRVESIGISKYLSGGLDRDGEPGVDHVSVFVTPLDGHGELVKAPGAFRVEAIDMAHDGADRVVGTWDFTALQAEEMWRKGVFGSGYTFQLPWKKTPQAEKVTLHVRMTTPDGRQFDATRELPIGGTGAESLAGRNRRRPAVAAKPSRTRTSSPRPAPGTTAPRATVPPAQDIPAEPNAAPSPPPFPEQKPVPPASRLDSSAVEPRNRPSFAGDPPGRVRLAGATADDSPFELPAGSRRKKPSSPSDKSPEPASNPFEEPAPRTSLKPAKALPRELTEPNRLESAPLEPPFDEDVRSVPIPTSDRWTEADRPVIR